MAAEKFGEMLQAALRGDLVLPEFQRSFKWKNLDISELFDSLRLGYPIGSMLLMAPNDQMKIASREFFKQNERGVEIPVSEGAQYILDGQQRITSGLILFHHMGLNAFLVDLNVVVEYLEEDVPDVVQAFRDGKDVSGDEIGHSLKGMDIDSVEYIKTSRMNLETKTQTRTDIVKKQEQKVGNGEIPTWMLWGPNAANLAPRLTHAYDGGELNLRLTIVEHLKPQDRSIPQETLGKSEPVEAITRIFEKINNTGMKLTPMELVVAVLYPHKINVRNLIDDAHASYSTLKHASKDGIAILQTMALFEDLPPKKSKLPSTVTNDKLLDDFEDKFNSAAAAIEDLAVLLDDRLGVALEYTDRLLPYEAALPPMAVAYKWAKDKGLNAVDVIGEWFVKSALDQRYQEGTHTKQTNDLAAAKTWIRDGKQPAWVQLFQTPSLLDDSVDGARGRLFQCLVNHHSPIDPVNGWRVGYPTKGSYPGPKGEVEHTLQRHHVFPRDKWEKYDITRSEGDIALNIMFLTEKTNRDWKGDDPHEHFKGESGDKMQTAVASQFISPDALAVLREPEKARKEYMDFLHMRRATFAQTLAKFNVPPHQEDEDEDQD